MVSTTIKTNIRAENRREATFSWLDGWTQLVDETTERSRGMTLELSNWFWEGVMMQGGVLSIDRAYFDLIGGRERWLYRVARKHAGGAGKKGFAISLPVLFEKSGSEGTYRRFKFEILKLAEKNTLPGYALSIEPAAREKEPLLRMTRIDGKDGAESGLEGRAVPISAPAQGSENKCVSPGKHLPPPNAKAQQSVDERPVAVEDAQHKKPLKRARQQNEPGGEELVDASALLRSTVAGLSDKTTRGFMTEDTIAHLREKCPGWDLYALHADFERWVDEDSERTPANWQKAFIGWVKRHHEKHGQSLRG